MCVCPSGVVEATDGERDAGWGRVCVFLQRMGKRGDSRSLSLAHCDLTATDLLEFGAVLPPIVSMCSTQVEGHIVLLTRITSRPITHHDLCFV